MDNVDLCMKKCQVPGQISIFLVSGKGVNGGSQNSKCQVLAKFQFSGAGGGGYSGPNLRIG